MTEFLGVQFTDMGYQQVIAELNRLSQADRFSYVVTPNVDHVVMLHEGKDAGIKTSFQEAYGAAALRLCDSRVLQLLAKFRGLNLEVATGSDLTAYLFADGHLDGKKVAIIGGDRAMLPDLSVRFRKVTFVQHIPPMGALKNPDAAREIENFLTSTSCEYVFFAFGSPQSEIIAHQCARSGRLRGVGVCIGASIEFILGRKARAPVWMQKNRLEWLFRLCHEPRRLWRRYLTSAPHIFLIFIKDLIFRTSGADVT